MQDSQKNIDHANDTKLSAVNANKKIMAILIVLGTVVVFIVTRRFSAFALFGLLVLLGDIYGLKEYRSKPTRFLSPTQDEVKARTKRNIALAAGLLVFVVLVFTTMVMRGQLPNAV